MAESYSEKANSRDDREINTLNNSRQYVIKCSIEVTNAHPIPRAAKIMMDRQFPHFFKNFALKIIWLRLSILQSLLVTHIFILFWPSWQKYFLSIFWYICIVPIQLFDKRVRIYKCNVPSAWWIGLHSGSIEWISSAYLGGRNLIFA